MSGLFPDVCKDCKEPKRHIGCHAVCKEYLEAKAEHAEKTSVIQKAKKAEKDADSAVFILKRN